MPTTPEPQTFETLWKMRMNTTPLAQTAGIVGAPKTASTELIRQATRGLLKGKDRKSIMRSLATSTARKPAAVVAAPPAPAPSAPASGFGGAGYSGANATQLEHASNPGWSTAAAPQPKP